MSKKTLGSLTEKEIKKLDKTQLVFSIFYYVDIMDFDYLPLKQVQAIAQAITEKPFSFKYIQSIVTLLQSMYFIERRGPHRGGGYRITVHGQEGWEHIIGEIRKRIRLNEERLESFRRSS